MNVQRQRKRRKVPSVPPCTPEQMNRRKVPAIDTSKRDLLMPNGPLKLAAVPLSKAKVKRRRRKLLLAPLPTRGNVLNFNYKRRRLYITDSTTERLMIAKAKATAKVATQ